jgi:two-component system, NtrC family, sensor histidine kinase HydH
MAHEQNVRSSDTSRSVWLLAAPSLAVSATLLAVAVCAAVAVFQMQREADSLLDEFTSASAASAELQRSAEELRYSLYRYGDQTAVRQVPDLEKATDRYLWQIERLELGNRGELIVRLRRIYVNLAEELQRGSSHAAPASQEADEFVQEARRQRDLIQQAQQQAQQESHTLTRWTGWTLLLLGVVGAGAGTLAGFGLARSMRQQLVQLSVPIQSAAGSLDNVIGPLQVSASGNIDDLEDSLHDLAARVASVVERLQAAELETLRRDQMAALGQLAAGLAHELRNPLTAIKTLVEAAREAGPQARLDDRDLAVLEEEIGRLDGTLQSFLDFARPSAACKTVLDLRDVVERTVQLVQARADRQSIRLETRFLEEAVEVTADSGQLRQVLLNLLLNAFDSVQSGGRVTVDVESDDGQIVVHVRDDGPGIPDSVRDRLFEPFVSSKPSGTGLGLTICRRIVENHGGQITAENRPEGGADFIIRLPADSPIAERSLETIPAGAGNALTADSV